MVHIKIYSNHSTKELTVSIYCNSMKAMAPFLSFYLVAMLALRQVGARKFTQWQCTSRFRQTCMVLVGKHCMVTVDDQVNFSFGVAQFCCGLNDFFHSLSSDFVVCVVCIEVSSSILILMSVLCRFFSSLSHATSLVRHWHQVTITYGDF